MIKVEDLSNLRSRAAKLHRVTIIIGDVDGRIEINSEHSSVAVQIELCGANGGASAYFDNNPNNPYFGNPWLAPRQKIRWQLSGTTIDNAAVLFSPREVPA